MRLQTSVEPRGSRASHQAGSTVPWSRARRYPEGAEFDNQGKTAARSDKVSDFVPIWQARLYTGEGKQTLRVYSVPLPQALAELALASDLGSVVTPDALLAFVDSLCVEFNGVPDARTLQARWTERAHGPGPNELVAAMRSIVDLHFPAVRFANMRLRSSCIIPDRSARGLRLRSAAGLVAAALVAERVNRPERVLGGARDLLDPVLATPEKTRQLVLI